MPNLRATLAAAARSSQSQERAAATSRSATPVGSRNVHEQARSLVAQTADKPLAERVKTYREALRARARQPMFQAALLRAMDGDARSALHNDPQGLELDSLDRDAADISDAEQAAAEFNDTWIGKSPAWCEMYFATYVARHGAADLGEKLGYAIGPTAGIVGRALGMAQRDGLISASNVRRIVANNPEIEQATTYALAQILLEMRERYKEAQAKVDSLEYRMQLELQDFGPALYDANEQDPAKLAAATRRVQAYIARFRSSDEYKAAKAELVDAANDLGVELDLVGDELLAHPDVPGAHQSTQPRTQLLDTYEALAGTEQGALRAVEWAERHASDPAFSQAERERIALISQLGQDTDATAKLQTVQQLMQAVQDAKDDAAKRDAFQRVLEFIDTFICKPYGQIETLRGITQFGQKLDELRRNTAIIASLLNGDAARALEIARQFLTGAPAKSATIVMRVWSGLGAMIGVFKGAQGLAGGAELHGAFGSAKAIYENLMRLRQLVNGTKGVVDASIEAQALALVDEIKGGFGSLKTMGFGLLGLAGSLMSLDEQIARAQAHPGNLGLQVQLAANIASIVGNALCLFPPLAPLGAMISSCAAVVSMIAGFFIGDPEGDQRREEAREIMAQPDVLGDPQLAETFTSSHGAENLAAAQAGGMTTDQIHALARTSPWAFTTQRFIGPIDALRRWLGRHTEIGHYFAGEPSLNDLMASDQRTLEELNYLAIMHLSAIERDEPQFGGGEEMYVTQQVEYLIPHYYVRQPAPFCVPTSPTP